jgi:DNA polymerase zeta
LKISFVDPSHNFRLATILQSGRVMRTEFQPHEVHIRYQLQFMLDYNVFGCDYIDLEDASFRLPVPEANDKDYEGWMWDTDTVPKSLIQPDGVHRTSFCALEIDSAAKHVLNRRNIHARPLHHDFDEDDHADLGANETLVPSLSGLWDEEGKRRVKAGLPATPPPPDPPKDQRMLGEGEAPQWMAEERLRALLDARITLDQRAGGSKKPRDFTKPHPLDRHIATTFDSVEIFHRKAHDVPDGESSGDSKGRGPTQPPPSTLFDLEHFVSQGSQARSQTEDMKEELDAEFFGTQAFQSDILEMEAQLGGGQNSDDEFDEEYDAAEQNMADDASSEPRTPRKDRTSRPATPRTPVTPRAQTPANVSIARSALRTPSKALASTNTVRFHSPLRQSSASRHVSPDEVGDLADESASVFHSSLPTQMSSAPPDATSGSPGWWQAHLTAQMKWRETAQTHAAQRVSASQSKGSANGRTIVTTPPRSTVPALTQLVASQTSTSTHSSKSAAAREYLPSSSTSSSPSDSGLWTYAVPAPTKLEVTASMSLFGVPAIDYQDPYYSNPVDVPAYTREYAGRSWRFASKTIRYLPDFPLLQWDDEDDGNRLDATPQGGSQHPTRSLSARPRREEMTSPFISPPKPSGGPMWWQYGPPPPSRAKVVSWSHTQRRKQRKLVRARERRAAASTQAKVSQPSGGSFGFKLSQRKPAQNISREKQHMTILALEVHANTRGTLLPDPTKDPIEAIVYSFQNEDEGLDDTGSRPGLRTGIIILSADIAQPVVGNRLGLSHLPIVVVESELEMFNALVDLVRELDPEILVGFEIHNGSWGYVIDRARHTLEFDLVPELSRVNNQSTGAAGGKADNWGWTQTSALKITGRHILNIWRLMRGELNLNVYTYENIVFHLLHSRVPKFPHTAMTEWYTSGRPHHMGKVLKYWVERVETDLLIIETSELVFRTAEFARIYGIDFFSVISRGSQFKVESVMFRIAKPECFLLPSPNTKQVAEQNAAECLPLIMEPQSAFYKGPLLVLDFQSLYPSVMIAHNLCYSTCLGRVSKFQGTDKFGIVNLELPSGLLNLLKDDVNISANGLVYVKPHIRKSLLAKMLTEILDTRVMIKGSTKGMKSDKAFMRLQNARQLSLKLLANVTYGYTSATFSGRMPCVEIADSIVQTGRETLEKAIELIHATGEWGAQVVYGDTDSLFIYLPDRSKDDAFRIGNEIADAVTHRNPKPIKLKFEKVYLPSVLLAKKRYVGFKYEALDEEVPEFNAKGIETVRRDGFPALQKMLEACIRLLFTTQDLSLVKSYCQKQWRAILQGAVAAQNFTIAKEVRLGSYSENGVPPPGAAVSTRKMLRDRRSEPQHAERVPYFITQGEPKAKLNDLAVSPDELIANPQLQLNALYYIQRGIIPPLQRVFNLLGADVDAWFKEMPRPVSNSSHASATNDMRLTLIDHYKRDVCLNCARPTERDLCLDCRQAAPATMYSALAEHSASTKKVQGIESVCRHCSGLTGVEVSPCVSLDCPVLYEREVVRRKERAAREKLARVEVLLEE